MQKFKDVEHLYQVFEGQADSYQEISRARDATQSRERWPLISAISSMPASMEVPPVRAAGAARLLPESGAAEAMPPTLAEVRAPLQQAGAAKAAAYTAPMQVAQFGAAKTVQAAKDLNASIPTATGSALHEPSPLAVFAQSAAPKVQERPSASGLSQVFARISEGRRVQ